MKVTVDLKLIPSILVLMIVAGLLGLLIIAYPLFMEFLLLVLFILFVFVYHDKLRSLIRRYRTAISPASSDAHFCSLPSDHPGPHQCSCGKTWDGSKEIQGDEVR